MPRLPYPHPTDQSDETGEALAFLPADLNIFRMISHAETAFVPWLRYGAALLGALKLDPVLRELAVLEVARLSPSRYEWVQHEAIAVGVGASADQIAAVQSGDVTRLSPDAAAIVDFTREVVLHVRASDVALKAVGQTLSDREVVELLLVIGQYMAVARLAETTGIDVDPPAQLAVADAAAKQSDTA